MIASPRRLRLLAATVAAIGLGACNGPPTRLRADDRPPASVPTDAEVADRVARVIDLHNDERAARKLSTLEVSPRLTRAARRHADDMARRKVMAHKGGDGSSPFDRIEATGYLYRRAGENVASGRFTPERVMKGWMDSPPHRRNVLGSFSQIGVACAIAEDGTSYWCATFGLPMRP